MRNSQSRLNCKQHLSNSRPTVYFEENMDIRELIMLLRVIMVEFFNLAQ